MCLLPSEPKPPILMTTISGKCPECMKPWKLRMPTSEYERGKLLRSQGGCIQDCFPYLKHWQRELLQTGICSPCFDEICPSHD